MKQFKYLFIIGLASSGLGLFLFFLSKPFTFESQESKTIHHEPVFNRIKFIPGWSKDIWIMQQSHQGLGPAFKEWDRLAIVVDKTIKPYQAKFYQFTPGEMVLASENEVTNLRVQCNSCHANGPRAIRPQSESAQAPLNSLTKFQISILNKRIKSYGKIKSSLGAPHTGKTLFASELLEMSAPLKLESCIFCHSKKGDRNELKLEHLSTAQFLVKTKQMPPQPYSISEKDKLFLETLSK